MLVVILNFLAKIRQMQSETVTLMTCDLINEIRRPKELHIKKRFREKDDIFTQKTKEASIF